MAEIPLFPLNTVLFPGATLPLHIFEERYKLMISRCLEGQQPFGVVLIRSGPEVGGTAEPFEIGTLARIAHSRVLEDGRMNIVTVGSQRFRLRETLHHEPYLTGVVDMLRDEEEESPAAAEAVERVRELYTRYSQLTLALNDEWSRRIALPRRPGSVADYVASRIEADPRTKQRLLEELSVPRRLALEQRLLENGVVLLGSRLESMRRQRYGGLGIRN